jgi:Uma2 family endonuclease
MHCVKLIKGDFESGQYRHMSIQHHIGDTSVGATIVPFGLGVPSVRRFTVDDYHRMIDAGILGENDRVELVDGWIVEMSPIVPPHATCVSLLAAAIQELLPAGWIVRVQSPITIANGEPEPDIAVVQGSIRDYRARHPSGADIAVVVEVADASLQFDRLQKRIQYAMAGIPEFWIVNLVDQSIEIYRNPAHSDYPVPEVFDSAGTADVRVRGQVLGKISVADVLP